MPQFAANISTMYGEFAFLDRFAAAADDGFTAVECQFPYDTPTSEIADRLRSTGLEFVLLNAPPGGSGERGLAALPGRIDDFRRSIEQAIEYANALGSPRFHVLAGTFGGDREAAAATYEENLAWACAQTELDIMIEPINQRDMPGYFLNRQQDAHDVVRRIGASNLKVQFDLYHCQIVEGDLTTRLRTDLPTGRVGHVQIASVPDRAEPDSGEVDYRHLFGVLDELGYDGWVGCEYIPRAGTSAGLGWIDAYR